MLTKKYKTYRVNPYEYVGAAFYEGYEIFDSHKFVSVGDSGFFELHILIFKERGTEMSDIYELGFGRWNSDAMELDDLFETNNNDVDNILATVAEKAVEFLKNHPNAKIFATGSTPGRTRLYQRQIGKNLKFIPLSLQIQGISLASKSGWEDFQNGINYDAFLLCAK